MNKRILEIQNVLEETQCAIITNNTNRRYLTGFSSSAGAVVITKTDAVFFVDFRYFEKASKTVKHIKIIKSEKLYSQINAFLKESNISEIYVETHYMSVKTFDNFINIFEGFKIIKSPLISETLEKQRTVKSPKEIEYIKEAQTITDKAFSHILNFIKAGVSEKEIALELEFFMRKNGCDSASFDIIAVSGKNSSLPHGVPSDKTIQKGEFLTMDFGGTVNGYCSDMTRTVAVGNVNDEQRKIYDIVFNAQTKAFEKIKKGAICKEVDAAARDYICEMGYGENFGHGLGHSVGLEIHESPSFNTKDETILEEGMVLTVEPGIYIENKFGVRIEDMVIVTSSGFENITSSTKELIVL